MESIDLCVPIYLNQQIVFDLLAILEDGFSAMSTIKTTNEEADLHSEKVKGSVGTSNVFAFLSASIGGSEENEKERKDHTNILKEKIHTPTSLFAKLRITLNDKGLLTIIKNQTDIDGLMCGQFVEMRVVLKKSPVVEMVETIKGVSEIFAISQEISLMNKPTPQKTVPGKTTSPPTTPKKYSKEFVDKINIGLAVLTQSNSLELVGELLDVPPEKVVLSTQIEYFNKQNSLEIIDGEFMIIGKITRIIGKDSSESINLLRKTPFGKLGPQMIDGFGTAMSGFGNCGFNIPKFESNVPGPVIQIIPIAIFTLFRRLKILFLI